MLQNQPNGSESNQTGWFRVVLRTARSYAVPLAFVLTLMGIVSRLAAIEREASSAVEWLSHHRLLAEPVTVEVKSGRRQEAIWQVKPGELDNPASDITTILRSGQPVAQLEIYHSAGDQRIRDYLPNFLLAQGAAPTTVTASVIKRDGTQNDLVVLDVEDAVVSLHSDHLHSILILDATGDVVAKTPYPAVSLVNAASVSNAYSAFRLTGSMTENTSSQTTPITFCNDFRILKNGDRTVFRFAWAIDNAGYASPHLFQIEEYELDGDALTRLSDPVYSITPGFALPESVRTVSDTAVLKRFLADVEIPSFSETLQELQRSPHPRHPPRSIKLPPGVTLPPVPKS